MGGRGASLQNSAGSAGQEKTLEQQEQEMLDEFAEVNRQIAEFMNKPTSRKHTARLEIGYNVIEHYTKGEAIEYLVKEFNEGYWDYDDNMLHVRYTNGKILSSVDVDKFPLSNIDGIIFSGDWGLAYAGNGVEIYNFKEAEYHEFKRGERYAPKTLQEVLRDETDLRIDFT